MKDIISKRTADHDLQNSYVDSKNMQFFKEVFIEKSFYKFLPF